MRRRGNVDSEHEPLAVAARALPLERVPRYGPLKLEQEPGSSRLERGRGGDIEDLGSKNGTHVNGQELTGPVGLGDGDEIQIALRFKLAFVDAGATAPLTMEGGEQGLRLDKETRQVTANDSLTLRLAPGGGQAIRFVAPR